MNDIREQIFGEKITAYLSKEVEFTRVAIYVGMYFFGILGVIIGDLMNVIGSISTVFLLDFAYHKTLVEIPQNKEK